jgi:pimeloyl-ACP methyl ester carboxylesterase
MYEVELNGVQLAVEEQGSGEAIMVVPGGLSDYRSWQPQVDLFSQRYHAISYSRRYQYPHHLVDDGNSSVSVNAADLAALIDRLGVAPAHIVGHSYGAFTALICAREHPELVRTLVLAEPPAVPLIVKDPNNPATILPLFFKNPRAALALMKFGVRGIKPAQEAFTRGDTAAAVQAFVRGITGRDIVVDELPPTIREPMRANGDALRAELDVSDRFTCEDARRISAPTLLVRGEQSPRFLGAITDRLSHCLPNTEQLVQPGTSHFLHWERPDEFNAGVQAFLARHSSRREVEQWGANQRMRRSG